GKIGVYVPDTYDAYLNGVELNVDPRTKQALATIDASSAATDALGYHIELSADNAQVKKARNMPAELIAFRKIDTKLSGEWVRLPWYKTVDTAKWIDLNSSQGFYMNVGSVGRLVGQVPVSKRVRIVGEFQIRE